MSALVSEMSSSTTQCGSYVTWMGLVGSCCDLRDALSLPLNFLATSPYTVSPASLQLGLSCVLTTLIWSTRWSCLCQIHSHLSFLSVVLSPMFEHKL